MAQYRALQDIYTDPFYIPAGVVFSDTPGDTVPQMAPQGWSPPAAVDPLTPDAALAFWNAGVQQLGLVRVARPQCYWVPYPPGGGTRSFILTGIGSSLGFRNWTEYAGQSAVSEQLLFCPQSSMIGLTLAFPVTTTRNRSTSMASFKLGLAQGGMLGLGSALPLAQDWASPNTARMEQRWERCIHEHPNSETEGVD